MDGGFNRWTGIQNQKKFWCVFWGDGEGMFFKIRNIIYHAYMLMGI